MEIVFVGTGVSTAIPVMGHFGSCACRDAIETPHSKNRRNNVSLLISKNKPEHLIQQHTAELLQHMQPKPLNGGSGGVKEQQEAELHAQRRALTIGKAEACDRWNILIDCGKTFRTAYFEQLIQRKVRSIDALLITHEHADAIQGLDDLRDLQSFVEMGQHYICHYYVPTFLSHFTVKTLTRQVDYIVRNSRVMGDAPANPDAFHATLGAVEAKLPAASRIIERRSTALDLWTVPDDCPKQFHVPYLCDGNEGIVMYSVPVEHGAGYMSLGFVFGSGVSFRKPECNGLALVDGGNATHGMCIAYISDVSFVPSKALAFLKNLSKIDILVVDLLLGGGEKHFSHFCLDDVWELVRVLQPRKVYGTGMYCTLEHQLTNASLASQLRLEHASGSCKGVESIELAYDGLTIPVAV
jgi:ribonuclease BN (tRNA processing enzyme)